MDNNQKKILALVAVVLVALLVAASISFSKPMERPYTPPPFEANASEGVPSDLDSVYNYKNLDLPIDDAKCNVWFSVTPRMEDGKLRLCFTVDKENTVQTSIIIYDEDQNELGRTGILKPGQYIDSIELSKIPDQGEKLDLKIITYEPETYYSKGSARAYLTVV